MVNFVTVDLMERTRGLGRHEFRVDHGGAEPLAEQSEAYIRDVLHRSQEHGAGAQFYVSNLHCGAKLRFFRHNGKRRPCFLRLRGRRGVATGHRTAKPGSHPFFISLRRQLA
jgi:hypothetical protein